ncbi:MAG: hypothetical protein IJY45_01510, partial [Tidjanibacter sp.]|nr:hypothetical protein [Tidjanibacter sp.]
MGQAHTVANEENDVLYLGATTIDNLYYAQGDVGYNQTEGDGTDDKSYLLFLHSEKCVLWL